MNPAFAKALIIVSLTVLWFGESGRLPAQTAGVLREVYTGISGTTVASLTNSATFPNNPSAQEVLTVFEAPINVDDNYGQRLSAYVVPPTTGNYVFWSLASLALKYRVDPGTNLTVVSMSYRGAGIYSGTIPSQSAGALVAFHIQAADNASPPVATTFPNDAPARECLVRFGETIPNTGRIGTYRFWITQATNTRWTSRERNSNEPLDATFVYGNSRVVYNIGTLYSGSPWHTPGYNGPLNGICDYVLIFPDDDSVLGTTDFVLASLGNLNNDGTAQREQAAFWMLQQLGGPTLYRRHVNLLVNGQQRGLVYEDSQQPSGEVIDEWFPDDNHGDLHKIEDWFEFDTTGDSKLFNVDATLQNFTTTGGAKKLARYRWNWRKRAVNDSANDYTNFFSLVDAVNAPRPEPYFSRTDALMDVEEWARVFAVEHIVGNWDSYGYNRGKNMYAYKPEHGKWNLIAWDIDFLLDNGGEPNTADVNPASIQGYDLRGNPIAGSSDTITITYTGIAEQPQDFLVITEIMLYNPSVPNAAFIEIYNRSTNTAFDVSNFRIDGADFAFPEGTIVQPGAFLVVANDPNAFAAAYGSSIPLAGVLNGKLSNGGETLKLVKSGATPDLDLIVDQVTYDSAPPWPTAANGFGPSLQLIDPNQDNNRVANWAASTTNAPSGPQCSLESAAV